MLSLRKRNGQSTAEYAILIGVVIAAVIGMQTWVGRSLKAKIRDAALNTGNAVTGYPTNIFTTDLFEPGISGTTQTTQSGGETLTRTTSGGALTRTYDQSTNRSGNQISPDINEPGNTPAP